MEEMGRFKELLRGSEGKVRGVSLQQYPSSLPLRFVQCASYGLLTQAVENTGDRDKRTTLSRKMQV